MRLNNLIKYLHLLFDNYNPHIQVVDIIFKKLEVYFNKYPPYLLAKNRQFIKFEPILILCLKVKNLSISNLS